MTNTDDAMMWKLATGALPALAQADPMPSLSQRTSKGIARATDQAIKEILDAHHPGWTQEQVRRHVNLVYLRTSSLTNVYWDDSKIGSYSVKSELRGKSIVVTSSVSLS